MLDRLIAFSLRHRALVLAAAAALCVVGAQRTAEMPVDVFPDVSAPRVAILTNAEGLAPVEIEQLVTYPIEAAVAGTGGMRMMRSVSAPGLSIVWVDFDWDTDGAVARQRVTERMQAVSLPPGVERPRLAPASSVMAEIAFLAVRPVGEDDHEHDDHDDHDDHDHDHAHGDHETPEVDFATLRRAVDADIRRRLLAVDGVAQVTVIGGDVRELHAIADPDRLAAYDLTAHDLTEAIERGSHNAAGGYVTERGVESIVRVLGRIEDADDLGAIPIVTRDGVPVRVRDVADVRAGTAVRRGTGGYDGQRAVVLGVLKQPEADTLATTAALDEALDALAPDLRARGMVIERESFRQASFIERARDNLFSVLGEGALLVALVLVVFLASLGATLVSVVALPLSLLVATLLLDAFGLRLDTMTLGGLAIAVGELVDDAIVDVENISRRLRERAAIPDPRDRPKLLATVLAASIEVRSAIVSATAIIGLVFVPLLFLEGFEGRLLRPLALAYLLAIAGSLLVALTVTPALSSFVLAREKAKAHEAPAVQRWLLRAYDPLLRGAMARPVGVALLALALLGVGLYGLGRAGRSFLPELNEGSLTITMVALPGISLADSEALGMVAEERLLSHPAVTSTTRRTGRADDDEHVLGPETNEFEVTLDPDHPLVADRDAVVAELRERLQVVPGNLEFTGPLGHRIEHMLTGQRAAIGVQVVGEDLDTLREVAERAKEVMARIEGLVDVNVEPIVDVPHLTLDVDEPAASRYGFSRGEGADVLGLALWGEVAGQVYETDGLPTDVRVRYGDHVRESRRRLREARVPTPSGALVPLEVLAEVREERSPNFVMRENGRRRVRVTANVQGRDLGSAAEAVREAVEREVERPPGVRIEHTGRAQQEERTTRRLLVLGLLALLGVALVVFTTLGSLRRAAIVLVNLPLALVGGVVGVHLAGTMSVATTIGFITLFGIATRNGLLLATRANELEAQGVGWQAAVRGGARERLAPILMTAVTAALGLVPLALALGEPGAEIQAPMALVILLGLVSSTALNMVVVPALLARWGGGTEAGADSDTDTDTETDSDTDPDPDPDLDPDPDPE